MEGGRESERGDKKGKEGREEGREGGGGRDCVGREGE